MKDHFEQSQLVCEKVVGLFHLFSNKVRFRTACMLLQGEACVQDIAEVVAAGKMTNVSQQLRMLRLSGVVTKRRDKKQILYSIADPKVGRMIEFLQSEFLNDQDQDQPKDN